MAYSGPPSYPSNAPAGAFNSSTTDPRVAGAHTSGAGTYYDTLRADAAMAAGGNSGGSTTAPAAGTVPATDQPAAPAAAAPAAAPASSAAPAAAMEADFAAAIGAGRVGWDQLPGDVQQRLTVVFGNDAPTAYESARAAAGSGVARGPRSTPAPRPTSGAGPFDADMRTRGAGTGNVGGTQSNFDEAFAGGRQDLQQPRPASALGGVPPPVAPAAAPPAAANVSTVAKNEPSPEWAVRAGLVPPPPAVATPPAVASVVSGANVPPVGDQGTRFTPRTMAPTNVARGAPQPAPPVAQAAEPPPPVEEPPPPVAEPLAEPGGTGVEAKTIQVRPGDTLSSIAAEQLGDPRRAWQIARANDLRNPNRIAPGMTLRLPTAAADMPSPRPRPTMPAPGGGPPVGDYFSGFLGGEPPFSGGAGANASPGQRSRIEDRRGFDPTTGFSREQYSGEGIDTTRGPDPSQFERGITPPPKIPNPPARPYRDPGGPGSDAATQDRMRQEFERLKSQRSNVEGGGTDVAALSDNDNGPRGPAMTNPSKPLPVPFNPNRMQDWLRRGIIPLTRPGNQAAVDYYGQFA